jgi:hypothetical protein
VQTLDTSDMDLDTSDIDLDTSEEAVLPGRHRAPASVARKMAVRLGIGALGVLLATGLGAGAADVLGLTGDVASEGAMRPFPVAPERDPGFARTIDVSAVPALPTDEPPAEPVPADPSPEQPVLAAAAAPVDEPSSESSTGGKASPAPVRTVRTGDSCRVVGQTAVTGSVYAAVCTGNGNGNGKNKWRAA